MPQRKDYSRSQYIKGSGGSHGRPHSTPPVPQRGLFDLPDGSSKRMPQRGGRPVPAQQKKSSGIFDLPSGAGKREAIHRQQKYNQKRQAERLGMIQKQEKVIRTPSGEKIFVGGIGTFSGNLTTSANLEKDTSKTRTQTAKFYLKEIGYYIKPMFFYFLAVFIYLLLGGLGKFNGQDIRIMCLAVFAPILVFGGVFVNRHLSVPGFALLGIGTSAGGLLGHVGAVAKAPLFIQRIIKLFNIPFFVFNTDSTKMDSLVLVGSVVAVLAFVYLGSRFHRITYILRPKYGDDDEKEQQNPPREIVQE